MYISGWWRPLTGSPFFWFAVFWVALECVALRVIPFPRQARADSVARNPNGRRGWPEYTSAGEVQSRRRVVLIGNSQAVALEIPDPRDTYAGLLQASLATRGVTLENWSYQGIHYHQVELLSLKAAQRKPDLVVFALGYQAFGPGVLLDWGSSDLPLLAGVPTMWPQLARTEIGHELDWDQHLELLFYATSSVGRARGWLLDLAGRSMPKSLQKFVFGQPRVEQPPPEYFAALRLDEGRMREDSKKAKRKLNRLRQFEVDERVERFRGFHEALAARFDEAGVDYAFVWIPGDMDGVDPRVVELLRDFHRRASAIVRARGHQTADLLTRCKSHHFVSVAHFNEEGHRIMAGLMGKVIVDALP